MEYTAVVVAAAGEPAPLQYLAPFAGCAMGEEWMEQGKDALIVYDDLSRHAAAYRTISLLLRRPPGREAYPGDVFYLHLPAAGAGGRLKEELGGGSLTALPIIETQAGDVSAYIPTNVISITDGQIYLETEAFTGDPPGGARGLVGFQSRRRRPDQCDEEDCRAHPYGAGRYRELAAFARFGSELDADTAEELGRGERILEALKQPQYAPVPVEYQIMILFGVVRGLLRDLPVKKIADFQEELFAFVDRRCPKLPEEIRRTGELTETAERELEDAVAEMSGALWRKRQQGERGGADNDFHAGDGEKKEGN